MKQHLNRMKIKKGIMKIFIQTILLIGFQLMSINSNCQNIKEYFLPDTIFNKSTFNMTSKSTKSTGLTKNIYYLKKDKVYDITSIRLLQEEPIVYETITIECTDKEVYLTESSLTNKVMPSINKKLSYRPPQIILKMPAKGETISWLSEYQGEKFKCTASWSTVTISGIKKNAIKLIKKYVDSPITGIDYYVKGIGLWKNELQDGTAQTSFIFVSIEYDSTATITYLEKNKKKDNQDKDKSLLNDNILTDIRDGKTYKTVKIGSQTWMAENLNYNASGSWCYKDEISNCNIYGRLYNWQTAKAACPSGWHLPSDASWTQLTDNLGGESVASGKMKEAGTKHWNNPNTSADNSSGFTAIPSGYHSSKSSFGFIGFHVAYWSSTEYDTSNAWGRSLHYDLSNVTRDNVDMICGFSVRCVKD